MRIILRLLVTAAIAYVVGFFIAGAIVFPVDKPYYAPRILLSLGFMAVVYGAESVLWQGHFETCGLLSGNCSQHDYSAAGWLGASTVFLLGVLVALRRERRIAKQKSEPSVSVTPDAPQ